MSKPQLYVLNPDNSINWTNYRLYLQQKHFNWANTESYYHDKNESIISYVYFSLSL